MKSFFFFNFGKVDSRFDEPGAVDSICYESPRRAGELCSTAEYEVSPWKLTPPHVGGLGFVPRCRLLGGRSLLSGVNVGVDLRPLPTGVRYLKRVTSDFTLRTGVKNSEK